VWPFNRVRAPELEGSLCPLLRGPCVKATCHWWVHIAGQDPQHANKQVDMWDCAMRWAPALAIDTARQVSGVHAAINSFRNEMVDQNKESRKFLNERTRVDDPGDDAMLINPKGDTNE
jgi:hypothetical protein